jgi:hypothetical protein
LAEFCCELRIAANFSASVVSPRASFPIEDAV